MNKYKKKKPTKMERMVKITSIIMVIIMLSSVIIGLFMAIYFYM